MASKRREQAAATRQKIIDASQKLIGEKGYLNVTVDDIATACGIAKGTLYHYFPGKEDIFIYIERGHFQEVRQRVEAIAHQSVAHTLRDFVTTWCQCVAGDNLNVSKDWHRLAVELKVPSKERCTHLDDDVDHISRYLRQGIEAGELSPEMPVEPIARDIAFSLYGASFYRCSTYGSFDIAQWGEEFAQHALDLHLRPYLLGAARENP